MLLLPFLPITALILQNATTLSNLLHYQVQKNSLQLFLNISVQREVERIGAKVYAATLLEKFITNMQRERSEVHITFSWQKFKKYSYLEVAFYIFTNGRQTLGLNLTERFSITDNALENMPWPDMDVYDATKMFKSKLRFQIRHGDFRQRISQDEEDIQSILNW